MYRGGGYLEGVLKSIHDNINEVDAILFIRYGKVEYAYLRSPYGKRTIWSCFTVRSDDIDIIVKLILNKRIVDSGNGYSISVLDNQPWKFNYPKMFWESYDRCTFKYVYRFCRYHLTTKEGSTLILGINTGENKFWCVDDVIFKWEWNPENEYASELLQKYCDVKNIDTLTELFCNNISEDRDIPVVLNNDEKYDKCNDCVFCHLKHTPYRDSRYCMSSKRYIGCFPKRVKE